MLMSNRYRGRSQSGEGLTYQSVDDLHLAGAETATGRVGGRAACNEAVSAEVTRDLGTKGARSPAVHDPDSRQASPVRSLQKPVDDGYRLLCREAMQIHLIGYCLHAVVLNSRITPE